MLMTPSNRKLYISGCFDTPAAAAVSTHKETIGLPQGAFYLQQAKFILLILIESPYLFCPSAVHLLDGHGQAEEGKHEKEGDEE